MDPGLLDILRCPVSGQRLRPATGAELQMCGLTEGLVREDGAMIFPVANGIPLLVPDAAQILTRPAV